MKSPLHLLRRTLAFASALLVSAAAPLGATEVFHWNQFAVDTTTAAMPLDPITESRILAIVHLAMHDALNGVNPRFSSYGPAQIAPADTSTDAAVAAAAHATLRHLLPQNAVAVDAEFAARLRGMQDDASTQRGIELGQRVAAELLAMRRNDGADQVVARAGGKQSGEYRPTPPDFTPAFLSHWGMVQPFAMTASQQFRPAPPPMIGSREALMDIEEVRALGGAVSQRRTFEQSEIASYWYEASTRGWNRIARDVAMSRQLDSWEQARMLALVHVAMADGFIGGFEAKYHYYYWRPATAVRESGDAEWLSYLPTPPVPDYPSTHTVLGAAAAAAMARCLGTDFVSFTMTSGAPYPNITRRFWSLSQAAMENGASRVFAGLHFATAVRAGYHQGSEIGAWVATNTLQPRDRMTTVKLTRN